MNRRTVGAALSGICGGLVGSILGFNVTEWQWWLVLAVVIVTRIIGMETA